MDEDCQLAVRETLYRCNPNESDYEVCLQRYKLSTSSTDLRNEVCCKIDGYTTPIFLSFSGGHGQVQRVHGMPMYGNPARYPRRE